jgi:hypothetical protein
MGAVMMMLLLTGVLIAAGNTPAKPGNSYKSAPVSRSVDGKGATDAITIPQMINYQGKLTDGSGTPINTPQNLTFKLYAESASGTAVWTETQTGVPVNSGLFNVLLGSVTPIESVPEAGNCWLDITVGTTTILPRQRIVSSAYCYSADRVDGVDANFTSPMVLSLCPVLRAFWRDAAWHNDSAGVWVDWDQVPQNYTMVRFVTYYYNGTRYPGSMRLIIGTDPVPGASFSNMAEGVYATDWVPFTKPTGIQFVSTQMKADVYTIAGHVMGTTATFR